MSRASTKRHCKSLTFKNHYTKACRLTDEFIAGKDCIERSRTDYLQITQYSWIRYYSSKKYARPAYIFLTQYLIAGQGPDRADLLMSSRSVYVVFSSTPKNFFRRVLIMKCSVYLSIVSASFAVIMFGCAKVPQQELSATKASLDSARVHEADKYVADDFSSAQDSLNAAITEIEKQKSANRLIRSFERAKALLAFANTVAKKAGAKAQMEKQKVQAEVDILLADPSKAKKELNWKPKVSFKQLVKLMVESDLQAVAAGR